MKNEDLDEKKAEREFISDLEQKREEMKELVKSESEKVQPEKNILLEYE